MTEHAITHCDGCGADDTDPKLHYGVETYHHDCAPRRVLNDIDHDTYPEVMQTVEAARDGVRGDALRQLVVDELHPGQTHGTEA